MEEEQREGHVLREVREGKTCEGVRKGKLKWKGGNEEERGR